MNLYSKIALIALVNAVASPLLWADESCGRLHVQISNGTHQVCNLATSQLVHGKYVSSPPDMILDGSNDRFDIDQTLRGPEVKLSYRCGDQVVEFTSQQNYCYMKAGSVSGEVNSQTSKIKAEFSVIEGSYYWDTPGMINWVLSSK